MPGGEAADNVAYAFEAEVDQAGGGEAGREAVVAEQQDLLVGAADVRVAPGAFWVDAPFEDGARDVERAGNDAVSLAVEVGANVDQEDTAFGCGERLGRFELLDPRPCRVEELFERSPQPNVVFS